MTFFVRRRSQKLKSLLDRERVFAHLTHIYIDTPIHIGVATPIFIATRAVTLEVMLDGVYRRAADARAQSHMRNGRCCNSYTLHRGGHR